MNNKIAQRKQKVAEALLSIKAVFLRPSEPFTWASGIKSPIYCDNRLTLAYPEVRNLIEESIIEVISEEYKEVEAVIGTSTAGIPHAAIVGDRMALPMGYVRSGAKAHGRNNQIEGVNPQGKNVVVVEDLISTGGSVIEVVDALREAGANVLGIVSIFTYTMKKGYERLKEANVKNISLSDIDALLEVAEKNAYVTAREKDMVKAFIINPGDESWSKK